MTPDTKNFNLRVASVFSNCFFGPYWNKMADCSKKWLSVFFVWKSINKMAPSLKHTEQNDGQFYNRDDFLTLKGKSAPFFPAACLEQKWRLV